MSKKEMNPTIKIILGIIIIIFIGWAIFGSSDEKQPVKMVFNISQLAGKSIDEVKKTLGNPSDDTEPTEKQLKSGEIDSWDKVWEKGQYSLIITYNPDSREVTEYTISSSVPLDDYNDFYSIGNTENILGGVDIKPVRTASDQTKYSALRLIVK